MRFICKGPSSHDLSVIEKPYEKTTNENEKFSELQIQRFSKDVCRSLVAMLDFDRSGKLGIEEFKTLLKEINQWKVSIETENLTEKNNI